MGIIIAKFVGIDVGKRTCVASVINERGQPLKTTKYANTREGVNEFLDMLLSGTCLGALSVNLASTYHRDYANF